MILQKLGEHCPVLQVKGQDLSVYFLIFVKTIINSIIILVSYFVILSYQHSKEINVTGSQKITDRGISNLLIQSTKSGNVPVETVVNGKCSIYEHTITSYTIH